MSGEDENSDFYEDYEAMNKKLSYTAVTCRDDLNSVTSLLHTCIMALTNPEWRGQENCQKWVAEVICDFIVPKVAEVEEMLKNL